MCRKIEKARVWSPLLALADSHHLLRLLRLSSNSSSTVGADTPTFPRKRRKSRASATRGRNPVETCWNPTPKYTAKVVQLGALKRKMQLAIDLFKNTAESRNPTTSNPTQCWKMALVMRLRLKYSAKDGQKMFIVVLPHIGAPCTPTPPQTNCRRLLVLRQRSWLC